MLRHSSRKLTMLVTVLALFAVGLFALADHKGKPHGGGGGGGGGEPPPNPVIAFDALSGKGTVDLMVSNADGTNQIVLLQGDDTLHFPSWAPGVSALVFEDYNLETDVVLLWIIDMQVVDGNVQVEPPLALRDNNNVHVEGFLTAWSPQGNLIAYVSNHLQPDGIWVIDLNTGETTQVVSEPIPNDEFDAGYAAWSPDGTMLAYSCLDPDAEYSEQYSIRVKEVADLDGNLIDGADVPLVNVGTRHAEGLSWSPDGRYLAYKDPGSGQDPQTGMHVVDLDLGAPYLPHQVLPLTFASGSPTWIPAVDTEEIVYFNRRGGTGSKFRIVSRNLNTLEETVLVQRKGFEVVWPDWRR